MKISTVEPIYNLYIETKKYKYIVNDAQVSSYIIAKSNETEATVFTFEEISEILRKRFQYMKEWRIIERALFTCI